MAPGASMKFVLLSKRLDRITRNIMELDQNSHPKSKNARRILAYGYATEQTAKFLFRNNLLVLEG